MLPDFAEWSSRVDSLNTNVCALTEALHAYKQNEQIHSPQLHEWEPFVIVDAVTLAGGIGALGANGGAVPAPNGWEAYVERITLLVSGASNAAVGAVFRGTQSPTSCIDIIPIVLPVVISTVTWYGNSANYASPAYFQNGTTLQVTVTGAGATEQAAIRVEGRRRQV